MKNLRKTGNIAGVVPKKQLTLWQRRTRLLECHTTAEDGHYDMRQIKSTDHKSDQDVESYNERPSIEQNTWRSLLVILLKMGL